MEMTDAVTDQDYQTYSDLHKDVYGYRPRHEYFPSYQAYLDSYHYLARQLEIILEEDEKRQHRSIVTFEQHVSDVQQLCNCSRERAILIVAQGETISEQELYGYNYGSLEYEYGLPYGYIKTSLNNAA